VRRFSLDRIFLAKKRHRLVVPQLALKSNDSYVRNNER
jgi:hypothetical protein